MMVLIVVTLIAGNIPGGASTSVTTHEFASVATCTNAALTLRAEAFEVVPGVFYKIKADCFAK